MSRGEEPQRLQPEGRRGKLLSELDLWDAQTFGLAFGIWDTDWIRHEVPPHIRLAWQARYAMQPWDRANLLALGKTGFKPAGWVQDLMDADDRRRKAKPQRRRFLTRADLRRRMKDAGY